MIKQSPKPNFILLPISFLKLQLLRHLFVLIAFSTSVERDTFIRFFVVAIIYLVYQKCITYVKQA